MRIGIYGYGNVGKGVELAATSAKDAELFGIFTRRPVETVAKTTSSKVYPAADVMKYKDDIDVMIVCGGSAGDLVTMTPELARGFNVVDSFDTHAKIPEHFKTVDEAAKSGGRTALISCGWDPGLFSLARLYGDSILPSGNTYTFWGRGVSQGHSDAARRVDGVIDAREYTIPREQAVCAVRRGAAPPLTERNMHRRECYVVAKNGADKAKIEQEIKSIPYYFDGYETTVKFITVDEMKREHSEMPHGGFVIRNGRTGEHRHSIEYRLSLDSNPEFTGSVLVAFARAIFRMNERGQFGCKTVFDIAPADISPLSRTEIIKKYT